MCSPTNPLGREPLNFRLLCVCVCVCVCVFA